MTMRRGAKDKGVAGLPVTPVSYAVVSDLYWVPTAEVDMHPVRDYFTVKARVQDYTGRRKGGMVEQPIPVYREDPHKRPGMIGLPIYEGERLFPADQVAEELSRGSAFDQWTRLPDPDHPAAAPGQREFMAEALECAQDYYTNLFKAETGTGKTVVALWLAATLGRSTLVRVPTEQLKRQWIDQAQALLGMDRKDIGVVQGEKCQYHKPLVIGMHKSIAMRDYPPEFYQAFGTVIDDELHNTGATLLSRNQGLFNAETKLGLTATDKRPDGADKVYHYYYGKPAFQRRMPGVPTTLYVPIYSGGRIHASRRDQLISALTKDHERNSIFAKLASKWYDEGHDILLVSEYVDHCYALKRYCEAMGIPSEEIGVYTNQRPANGISGPREKTPQKYLDWCKAVPAVFIATYGMFKEGLDVPRLSHGMDCTPRSQLEQLIGRVRRRTPDNPDRRAVWVSLRDRETPKLDGMHYGRMRSVAHLDSVQISKTSLEALLGDYL